MALTSLPGLGPARCRWLLESGSAEEVVASLRGERLPPTIQPAPPGVTAKLVQKWAQALRRIDPDALLAGVAAIEAQVLGPDDELWPYGLDPEPPVLLFAQGDRGLLAAAPVVAVVGTRRCSTIGRRAAFELGAELAEAGVSVVSGLASGVDGAAHRGVLSAHGRPIGVVGTGLDVVYPAANRQLWHDVVARGLLLSEAAPGTGAERWRFPARNRLIAGLAQVVVIVESHDHGGSMHTVSEALDRGLPVMAVPGAVTNPAASGTNRLLVEGCPPARSAQDVLDYLGLSFSPDAGSGRPGAGPDPGSIEGSPLEAMIVRQVAAGSVHVDDLIGATGVAIPEVLSELNRLCERGVVQLDGSTVSLVSAL
jgi:DNA processing protein